MTDSLRVAVDSLITGVASGGEIGEGIFAALLQIAGIVFVLMLVGGIIGFLIGRGTR